MKNLLIIAMCISFLSCDNNTALTTQPDSIVGLWSREIVYLNGVNSNEYVDFLNNGTNFLNLYKDKSFSRAYDNGTWRVLNDTLKLKRDLNSGMGDWTYKIIDHTKSSLTLETKLTEGQYCCGFDQFTDTEIITIKEVYKKGN